MFFFFVALDSLPSFSWVASKETKPPPPCLCTVVTSWWCQVSAACWTMQSRGSFPVQKGTACLAASGRLSQLTCPETRWWSPVLWRTGRCAPATWKLLALTWLSGRCWPWVRTSLWNPRRRIRETSPRKVPAIWMMTIAKSNERGSALTELGDLESPCLCSGRFYSKWLCCFVLPSTLAPRQAKEQRQGKIYHWSHCCLRTHPEEETDLPLCSEKCLTLSSPG